jgi:hypothetical protein
MRSELWPTRLCHRASVFRSYEARYATVRRRKV